MLQYICNSGFVSGGCSLGQVFPSSWSLIQQTEIRAYLDLQRKTIQGKLMGQIRKGQIYCHD